MKILDQGFEIIATGLEMIEVCIETTKDLYGSQNDEPKQDHPATFEQSLREGK